MSNGKQTFSNSPTTTKTNKKNNLQFTDIVLLALTYYFSISGL